MNVRKRRDQFAQDTSTDKIRTAGHTLEVSSFANIDVVRCSNDQGTEYKYLREFCAVVPPANSQRLLNCSKL